MLKLNLKKEPYWLDVAKGVRLKVLPCTTALIMSARTSLDKEADSKSADFIKELGLRAVLDWEGVGDDQGKAIKPDEQSISALFELWPIADAFERKYLAKGLLLEEEKNE